MGNLDSHVQKNEMGHCRNHTQKLKWIKVLKVRPELVLSLLLDEIRTSAVSFVLLLATKYPGISNQCLAQQLHYRCSMTYDGAAS